VKNFTIPILSVTLLLGSSLAHSKPKTAKDFHVDESSSMYDDLEFVDYLLSNEDGEPTQKDIQQAAPFLIKAALRDIHEPYCFILMLTDHDEEKVKEILHSDENTAVLLFLKYYENFYKDTSSL
jgi:hypothetical protein